MERNRKLALALNIDRSSHVDGGDHIPYSAETLTLFQQYPKWAQNQEREFRVFSADGDEKRLRFKPMKASERAFIHHLAEDFGFDSESMDPEPHRHVLVFKSPRFVSAPNKIISECVRIRAAQNAAAGKVAGTDSDAVNKGRANEVGDPFNSFIITKPRFGLVVEEVRTEIMKILSHTSPFQFDIEFLPNEEVILKAMTRTLDSQALEQMLKDVKASLADAITSKSIGTLQLCRTDTSLNVTRREADSGPGDGWSRVAAKGAAPKRMYPQSNLAGRNAFSALGGDNGKVTFSTKKKKPVKVVEPVVDDWEAAEIAEEEKENVASGAASGSEDVVGEVEKETADAQEAPGVAQEAAIEAEPDFAQDAAAVEASVEVEPDVAQDATVDHVETEVSGEDETEKTA